MRPARNLSTDALKILDDIYKDAAKHLSGGTKGARKILRRNCKDYQEERWWREIVYRRK